MPDRHRVTDKVIQAPPQHEAIERTPKTKEAQCFWASSGVQPIKQMSPGVAPITVYFGRLLARPQNAILGRVNKLMPHVSGFVRASLRFKRWAIVTHPSGMKRKRSHPQFREFGVPRRGGIVCRGRMPEPGRGGLVLCGFEWDAAGGNYRDIYPSRVGCGNRLGIPNPLKEWAPR